MNKDDRYLRIKKAGSVSTYNVPSLRIELQEEIQEYPTLEDARAVYADQGTRLAAALITSLPGGTLDCLLAELMRRRASLFMVPIDPVSVVPADGE